MPTGFTYASGVQTETISLRCPICLIHRPVTQRMLHAHCATTDELCCSGVCCDVYMTRLLYTTKVLYKALQRRNVPKQVTDDIRQKGTITTVVSNHLRQYYNGE